MGLFSGELIVGEAYYWREFCVSKWVGLDNKNGLKYKDNSLKQLQTANPKGRFTRYDFCLRLSHVIFYSARCLRHAKIVYNFHDIKLPVATIVVGF